MNRFSLLISTCKNLNMSESRVLKFNYSDSFVFSSVLIYTLRLQWVRLQCWQQTHSIRYMFDSLIQIHKFRKLLIILINASSVSNHSSTFTFSVNVLHFTKKEEEENGQRQSKKKNSKSYRLCKNVTLENPLPNCGRCIAEIILSLEKKFCPPYPTNLILHFNTFIHK